MKFCPGVVPQWPSSRGLMCCRLQRLAQQRIVEQIDLTDGQIVRGAPVRVHARQEIGVDRGVTRQREKCVCGARDHHLFVCRNDADHDRGRRTPK